VNDDSDYNDDDEAEFEDGYDGGVYIVDDDTARLLDVVVGMIHMLASTQMEDVSRENCLVIADELSERFGIGPVGDSFEVEEIIHGDEVFYKPRGGVMGDDPLPPEDEDTPTIQ
jgi:hypothetical protein